MERSARLWNGCDLNRELLLGMLCFDLFSIGVKDFLRPMLGSLISWALAKRLELRTSWITLNQSPGVAIQENSNFGYLGRFFLISLSNIDEKRRDDIGQFLY